jgi:hypothetical protein
MGGQSSKASNKVFQDILQKQVQNCPNFSCQQKIGKIEVIARKGSEVKNIKITQNCQISGECVYNALLKSLAEAIQGAESKAKGGVGIQFDVAKNEAETIVKQIQEQNCGNMSSEQIAEEIIIGADDNMTLDTFEFSQISNLNQRCLFEAMSDNIAKLNQTSTSEAAGFDPLEFIKGLFSSPGFLIILIIIIGVVVGFAMFKSGGSSGSGASGTSNINIYGSDRGSVRSE